MHKITELKAGEFIDLQEYAKSLQKESEDSVDIIEKFYLLLNGQMPKTEKECFEIVEDYARQIEQVKEDFEFIFNPPPMPSTIESQLNSIGDEYRKEFAEMYGGWVELVYLISKGDPMKHLEVMEMRTQDFLFWGNYLLHKKFVENIK